MLPREPTSPPRSALGRADLLRYLAAVGHCETLWVADDFGYRALAFEEKSETSASLELPSLEPSEAIPQPSYATLLKRHKAKLYGVLARTPKSLDETATEEPAPWDPASAEPLQAGGEPPFRPLIPWPRFCQPLSRALKRPGAGAVDWSQVILACSQRQPLRRWPRQSRPRWSASLTVLLDFGPRMQAYRQDLLELRQWLLRWRGHNGLALHHLFDGPEAHWCDGLTLGRGGRYRYPPPRRVAESSQVLIVSDLGRLSAQASARAEWQGLVQRLQRSGADITVLCPMSEEHLNQAEPWLNGLPALCWNGATPPRVRTFRRSGEPGDDEALQVYLAIIALLRRVDRPLLRALRQVHPLLARDAGLEGRLWNHADMEHGGRAAWVSGERQQEHLERWRTWSGELSQAQLEQLLRVVLEQHQSFNRGLLYEEALRLSTHLGSRLSPEWRQQAEAARGFFASLRTGADEGLRWYARAVVQFADAATREQERQVLQPLRDFGYAGQRTSQAQDGPESWLVQQGGDLVWQTSPAGRGQFALAGPLHTGLMEVTIGDRPARIFPRPVAPQVLAPLAAAPITVDTGQARLILGEFPDRWWAIEIGRDQNGPYCLAPLMTGQSQRLSLPLSPAAGPQKIKAPGAWLIYGLDEQGDWYLDLSLKPKKGNPIVTQRLRWIPPGEFLMGSPGNEPERFGHEGPQHRVILTEGYWLADTACTQALWQAVMGNNPSRFLSDPENPVEQVSWHEVQDFLQRLSTLAGVKVELPSEAQWEYACRAGTETPFWWGSDLDSNKANYDGNLPYAHGEKGEYRERTVPVKSFTPNPWGLWQMHGNVWEWCRDGLRDYQEAVAVNPEGPPAAEGYRALRGGSWGSLGRLLRAANRSGYWPGYRNDSVGFRFLLRSLQPGARRAPA